MCNSNLKITLHYWNNEEITTLIVLLKSCNQQEIIMKYLNEINLLLLRGMADR